MLFTKGLNIEQHFLNGSSTLEERSVNLFRTLETINLLKYAVFLRKILLGFLAGQLTKTGLHTVHGFMIAAGRSVKRNTTKINNELKDCPATIAT